MRNKRKIQLARPAFAGLLVFSMASWAMFLCCFVAEDVYISTQSIVITLAGLLLIFLIVNDLISRHLKAKMPPPIDDDFKEKLELLSSKELNLKSKIHEADLCKRFGSVFEKMYNEDNERETKIFISMQALYCYTMALIPENQDSENEAIRNSKTKAIARIRELLN